MLAQTQNSLSKLNAWQAGPQVVSYHAAEDCCDTAHTDAHLLQYMYTHPHDIQDVGCVWCALLPCCKGCGPCCCYADHNIACHHCHYYRYSSPMSGYSHAAEAGPIDLPISLPFEVGIGCICTLQTRHLLNYAHDELSCTHSALLTNSIV